jgi:hypothetical protein
MISHQHRPELQDRLPPGDLSTEAVVGQDQPGNRRSGAGLDPSYFLRYNHAAFTQKRKGEELLSTVENAIGRRGGIVVATVRKRRTEQ